MDRHTHVPFAPIFSLGATVLISKNVQLVQSLPIFLNIAIPTAASLLTAMAPDADLHAYKPMFVIWGQPHPTKRGKSYFIKVREKNGFKIKEYTTPNIVSSDMGNII